MRDKSLGQTLTLRRKKMCPRDFTCGTSTSVLETSVPPLATRCSMVSQTAISPKEALSDITPLAIWARHVRAASFMTDGNKVEATNSFLNVLTTFLSNNPPDLCLQTRNRPSPTSLIKSAETKPMARTASMHSLP